MADPQRPSPRQRVDRAVAAARPAVDKARAKAEPAVEKAAKKAGTLFGAIRERATETAKGFGDGYKPDAERDARPDGEQPRTDPGDAGRRRPKPGPG